MPTGRPKLHEKYQGVWKSADKNVDNLVAAIHEQAFPQKIDPMGVFPFGKVMETGLENAVRIFNDHGAGVPGTPRNLDFYIWLANFHLEKSS